MFPFMDLHTGEGAVDCQLEGDAGRLAGRGGWGWVGMGGDQDFLLGGQEP